MSKFELVSKYQPTGDQPQAIKFLTEGIKNNVREQVLKGVTGSGKTFTMANIIQNIQKPTLILAHNKTLAAQLYSEFRDFVSYFDYYQPEAYIASSDTYIEKDSAINEEIDRLRHAATVALLTRPDTIIVASVSCIYGIGSPDHYIEMSLPLIKNENHWKIMNENEIIENSAGAMHDHKIIDDKFGILDQKLTKSLVDSKTQGSNSLSQNNFMIYLVAMQYHRNDIAFERGNFRVRGDSIDLFPASGEVAYRFEFGFDSLENVKIIDPLTAEVLEKPDRVHIFPNTHYATPRDQIDVALETIRIEYENRLKYFNEHDKYLEAQRLSQRTKYDLEMLESTGFVKGIENYSRHLDGRKAGEPPATLLDFFPKDFLLMVDESHMTLPQVRGMYNGDHARKETLVEYGFRLPSALDNRPLTFNEFQKHIKNAVYVSATPGDYEISHATNIPMFDDEEHDEIFNPVAEIVGTKKHNHIVEQIIL